MRRLWKVLLAVVVVAIVVSVVTTVAVAWPGAPNARGQLKSGELQVSGTFETLASREDPNVKVDGDTLVLLTTDYNLVHGSFEGISRVDSTLTLNTVTGAFTMDSVETFTGTLNGVAGTLVSKGSGTGQMLDATGTKYIAHGGSTFLAGTGGLAAITGGTLSYELDQSDGVEKPVEYSGTSQIK